jgi:1,4-alpha-glucan branching enzyme
MGQDILQGFREFNDLGRIEIITCAATDGYFPLLGTDESIVAQIKTGAATRRKYLGKPPRLMWVPECGRRPAGAWQTPVIAEGSNPPWEPFERIEVEEALYQGGIQY